MLVREIPGEWSHSLLEKSPLWHREVQSLSALDISVFLRRHMGTAQHYSARKQVDELLRALWSAVTAGELSPVPKVCFFAPPVERLTYGELREWLERVSPVRRNAILFGLETGLSVEEVIELEWKALPSMQLTAFAQTLTTQHPRHFRLPYVFWEVTPFGAASPLIGLADSVQDVTEGRGYQALAELYRDAIPMDQDADLRDFLVNIDRQVPDQSPDSFTIH